MLSLRDNVARCLHDEYLDKKNTYKHNDDDPLLRMMLHEQLRKHNITTSYAEAVLAMQLVKTCSQRGGYFWQKLFGMAPGWDNLKTGHATKCDLIHHQRKIVMELKNKYNTMNSDSMSKVVEKLTRAAQDGWVGVLGIVNDTKEDGRFAWLVPNKVLRVSGKRLFELIYDDPNAYYEIFETIAMLTNDTENAAKYMTRRILTREYNKDVAQLEIDLSTLAL